MVTSINTPVSSDLFPYCRNQSSLLSFYSCHCLLHSFDTKYEFNNNTKEILLVTLLSYRVHAQTYVHTYKMHQLFCFSIFFHLLSCSPLYTHASWAIIIVVHNMFENIIVFRYNRECQPIYTALHDINMGSISSSNEINFISGMNCIYICW